MLASVQAPGRMFSKEKNIWILNYPIYYMLSSAYSENEAVLKSKKKKNIKKKKKNKSNEKYVLIISINN